MADASATDSAGKAGGVGDEVGVAMLVWCAHGGGGNLLVTLELDLAVVACRQCAKGSCHVHHRDRAETGKGHAPSVIGQCCAGGTSRLHERLFVGGHDPDRAAHGDGLELFRAHHGADTRTPGGTMQIVDDAGKATAVFTGWSDGCDANQGVLVCALDGWLDLPH